MKIKKEIMESPVERIAVFINLGSLGNSIEKASVQVDLLTLRDYLAERRLLIDSFCYLGFSSDDPKKNEYQQRFVVFIIPSVKRFGYVMPLRDPEYKGIVDLK